MIGYSWSKGGESVRKLIAAAEEIDQRGMVGQSSGV